MSRLRDEVIMDPDAGLHKRVNVLLSLQIA